MPSDAVFVVVLPRGTDVEDGGDRRRFVDGIAANVSADAAPSKLHLLARPTGTAQLTDVLDVGQLRRHLRDLGLADDTVVLVSIAPDDDLPGAQPVHSIAATATYSLGQTMGTVLLRLEGA